MVTKTIQDPLRSLFSSSIRGDVLNLLLNNPEEKFYVREIATLLRKNPSGVKRELDNLEKMGILVSKRVANLKYFQADKKSSLYSELKSLITKSLGVPGALKTILRKSDFKIALIFGPYTESEETEAVDLLVVGPPNASLDGVADVEQRFNKKIRILKMDEGEYREGRERKDSQIEGILSGNKILLMGKI